MQLTLKRKKQKVEEPIKSFQYSWLVHQLQQKQNTIRERERPKVFTYKFHKHGQNSNNHKVALHYKANKPQKLNKNLYPFTPNTFHNFLRKSPNRPGHPPSLQASRGVS